MEVERSRRSVVIWLLVGCVMIACMVAIGGITRLTGSGLSITEWKPIMGALPPMNEAEWNEAFTKYKGIPQYALINEHLDLAGFKDIFFWEYVHRNWGRLMGLVFLAPFGVFWWRGVLKGWLMMRSLLILIAGGIVGGLGWFMVKSGLLEGDSVSHYRLAIHLCAAFSVFALVLWTIFDIRRGRSMPTIHGSRAQKWSLGLLVLLVLQITFGAFTAGIDAGHVVNTWPLMHGHFLSEQATSYSGTWRDFVEQREGVQFVHRNLAWLVAAAFSAFAYRFRNDERLQGAGSWLFGAVVVQFLLGVFTLVHQVPIVLGVLHQFGALLLLSAVLNVMHRSGRITAS
jgi:heme a synthase